MSFDSVCKFIAENFTTDITTWLLGESVELASLESSELLTSPIYADSLVLLESQSLVLQIEFQVEPKREIPFRMADYAMRAYRRFPEKQLRQVVVYLRRSQSPLVAQTTFERGVTRHSFEVIRIWEQPVGRFQELPGLLPFAVLGQTSDPVGMLRQVSERIEEIGDPVVRADVAASAAILAGLVLDKQLVQSVLREDVMKESVIYQDIEQRGRTKGELSLVLRQLKHRFGALSPALKEQIEGLPLTALEDLGEALLDFPRESDLLAWLQERS